MRLVDIAQVEQRFIMAVQVAVRRVHVDIITAVLAHLHQLHVQKHLLVTMQQRVRPVRSRRLLVTMLRRALVPKHSAAQVNILVLVRPVVQAVQVVIQTVRLDQMRLVIVMSAQVLVNMSQLRMQQRQLVRLVDIAQVV